MTARPFNPIGQNLMDVGGRSPASDRASRGVAVVDTRSDALSIRIVVCDGAGCLDSFRGGIS
jgi:hypothetical protein